MQDTATTIDKPREPDHTPQIDWSVPREVVEQLQRNWQLVLTDRDRPVAIMLKVDDSTLKDTLLDLRRLRADKIINKMQAASVKNGMSNMTLDEINAEIAAARAERRARSNSR